MPTPKLPKAERAIIAAHEAGMHDRKPTPATCRPCAQDEAEAQAKPVVMTPRKPRLEPGEKVTVRAPRIVKTERRYTGKTTTDGEAEVITVPVETTAPRKPRTEPLTPAPVVVPMFETTPESAAYTSRESWLLAAVDAMRPAFEAIGFPVPERVQVSVGWPGGRGKKSGVIGQCWPTSLAGDGMPHIFISPVLTDTVEVLGTVAHELVHASVPKGTHHKGAFVKAARAIGLTAPWTATKVGEELRVTLTALAASLGEYRHGGLSQVTGQVVQKTRMLKVTCTDCGCLIRMTSKWIEKVGVPTCACGGEMEAA